MLALTIFASLLACALGANVPTGLLPQLDGRIVGGAPTEISLYPWQISIQRSGSHNCGGSILTSNIIVTAAHCLKGAIASSLKVRAGSTTWTTGGVLVNVAAIKIHEGYNSFTMVNDIGIMRLESSLAFSSAIRAISLATQAPADGAAAVVSGWGTLKSGASTLPTTLQFVEVNIVSETQCGSKDYSYGEKNIYPTMICAAANGKDACQGDSGGPLVSGGKLVGVVSWGYGCANPKYPGVYADVAALNAWVMDAASKI